MRGSPRGWKAWCRPQSSIIYYLRWCRSSRQYTLGWWWNYIFDTIMTGVILWLIVAMTQTRVVYRNQWVHMTSSVSRPIKLLEWVHAMFVPVSAKYVGGIQIIQIIKNQIHFKLKNSNSKVLNFHKYTVSTNCNMGLKPTLVYLPHCYWVHIVQFHHLRA